MLSIIKDARFKVLTTVKIQVEVFWVVMLCNVVGYQHFGGSSKVLLNVGILPKHCISSQPGRP
jgi:hypothetical protein